MKKAFSIALFFISCVAYAQKQNNNWCFGLQAAIDFNATIPTVFSSASNASEGGAATVSDRYTGALLFYTDGVKIWDGTHTAMPNGKGIGTDTTHTCAGGSVIVPDPANSDRYYVFALEEEKAPGAVYYSVVDMTLNGGKGDVVAGQKKIKIASGFNEGMTTAVSCDGYWLILFERLQSNFVAYKITSSGINMTPVVSPVSLPVTYGSLNGIKVSPDAKQLLFAVNGTNKLMNLSASYIALCDINVLTGIISNERIIDTVPGYDYYSCAFSPDGTKGYASQLISRQIVQFDISLPTPVAIKASKKIIHTFNITVGDIQSGSGGDIYVSVVSSTSLDKISNANSSSPVYTVNAIPLAIGTRAWLSLPQSVLYPTVTDQNMNTATNLSICNGKPITLEGRTGSSSYLWQNYSTLDYFKSAKKGVYWVKSITDCKSITDTFILKEVNLSVDLGNDTTICTGDEFVITLPYAADSISYLWQNGSIKNNIALNERGLYYVTVSTAGCVFSDTIDITVNSSAVFDLGVDTTLCTGTVYGLRGPVGFELYKWNSGSGGNTFNVDKPGQYSLAVKNGGCSYRDSINIAYLDEHVNLGNDTLLCTGERLLLNATLSDGSIYVWSDGSHEATDVISQSGKYWVTVSNKCGLFSDTILTDFKNCDCKAFVPSGFTPNNDGLNDRLKPLLDCEQIQFDFFILNRFGEVVFKSKNPADRWDGTCKSQQCELGTYFYQLKIKNVKGDDFLFKGDIVLIR